jgi:hypothetical protein
MMELGQSGLNRGVGKNDRRAVYESPGGNGSGEGIPYRRVPPPLAIPDCAAPGS